MFFGIKIGIYSIIRRVGVVLRETSVTVHYVVSVTFSERRACLSCLQHPVHYVVPYAHEFPCIGLNNAETDLGRFCFPPGARRGSGSSGRALQ